MLLAVSVFFDRNKVSNRAERIAIYYPRTKRSNAVRNIRQHRGVTVLEDTVAINLVVNYASFNAIADVANEW